VLLYARAGHGRKGRFFFFSSTRPLDQFPFENIVFFLLYLEHSEDSLEVTQRRTLTGKLCFERVTRIRNRTRSRRPIFGSREFVIKKNICVRGIFFVIFVICKEKTYRFVVNNGGSPITRFRQDIFYYHIVVRCCSCSNNILNNLNPYCCTIVCPYLCLCFHHKKNNTSIIVRL
jgi:hypothetical protein